MKERPTSITVIAWILIVTSAISLLTVQVSLDNPMARELMSRSPIPIPVQHAMIYLGVLISFISGVAILKGQNWARFLYLIWSIIAFGVGIATSPMKAAMIPGLVLFLVVAFFLFRPKANDYFAVTEAQCGAESN